jgi:hypothetical protein
MLGAPKYIVNSAGGRYPCPATQASRTPQAQHEQPEPKPQPQPGPESTPRPEPESGL